MKLSRWTSFINLPNGTGVVFQALTDSFLCIKKESEVAFSKIKNQEWHSMSPEFLSQLEKAGITVEDDKDEVGELKEIIHNVDHQDTTFEIIVNPTLDCNFNCWYCYENHVKGSAMSSETVQGIKELAKRKIKELPNLRELHISFFGGEPLMRFDQVVRPILTGMRELTLEAGIYLSVHFTSNSFLLNDQMIEFLKDFPTSFQITLDGGRDNHNKTRFGKGNVPSFDVILNNIRKLAMAGVRVILRVNYTSKNIASTEEIVEIVENWPEECRTKVGVDFQKVWQDSDADSKIANERDSKVKELRDRLRKIGYNVHNQKVMNYVANSCYGDKVNEVVINYNGDVFACTARDFTSESRLGELKSSGEIVWDEERYQERMGSRFTKKICHECRIAPICGGGCKTKCIENAHHENCNIGYTPEKIDDMILERFEERFLKES